MKNAGVHLDAGIFCQVAKQADKPDSVHAQRPKT
jgi:hypothetical protein